MSTPAPITPSDDGCYIVELLRTDEPTALTGKIYDGNSVRDVIQSEHFLHRVSDGLLRGTIGGPFKKADAQMDDLTSIDESSVGFSITDVSMNGNVVTGKVRPAGPKGETFKELLDNGPVAFGMRAIVKPRKEPATATTVNEVRSIITWDLVSPPQ